MCSITHKHTHSSRSALAAARCSAWAPQTHSGRLLSGGAAWDSLRDQQQWSTRLASTHCLGSGSCVTSAKRCDEPPMHVLLIMFCCLCRASLCLPCGPHADGSLALASIPDPCHATSSRQKACSSVQAGTIASAILQRQVHVVARALAQLHYHRLGMSGPAAPQAGLAIVGLAWHGRAMQCIRPSCQEAPGLPAPLPSPLWRVVRRRVWSGQG